MVQSGFEKVEDFRGVEVVRGRVVVRGRCTRYELRTNKYIIVTSVK